MSCFSLSCYGRVESGSLCPKHYFFSFIFIKDIKERQLGPRIQSSLLPFLIASFLSLVFPNLIVFSCHFPLFPPVPVLPGFREDQSLGQGQGKSELSTHILILPTPRPFLFSVQLTQDPSRTVLRWNCHLWNAQHHGHHKKACVSQNIVYVYVCGGGNHFCWKKRIKLENARTLHLCKALATPRKCHKLPAKSLSPRLLVLCSTSPWEHLVLANFSLLYDQRF